MKLVSPERATHFAKILGYSPITFVELALQRSVKKSGLAYSLTLHSSGHELYALHVIKARSQAASFVNP